MGRKNHELQAQAIDNVMTSMSQIALLDRALEFANDGLPTSELALFDAEQKAFDSLSLVQDVDIDRQLLTDMTANIVPDLQDLPRIIAKELLAKIIGARKDALIAQQKEYVKPIRSAHLNILLGANAIVTPTRFLPEREFTKYAAATPQKVGESLLLRVNGRFPLQPKRASAKAPFHGYVGYSLNGYPKDRLPRYVSLVDLDGHPQVTITPR